MDRYHGYVGVQARGAVALPPELRRRLHHLDGLDDAADGP
jgi:hypothetical protein